MDEVKKLQKSIEHHLLKDLIERLKSSEITREDAKERASLLLELEPFDSLEDIQAKTQTFVEKYTEYDNLNSIVKSFIDEKGVRGIIDRMSKYIDNKDIDGALEVAQEQHA